MIKKYKLGLLLLICLFIANSSYAQHSYSCSHESFYEYDSTYWLGKTGLNSEYGLGHTPRGELNIMMVYVTFIEDDTLPGEDEISWFWPKNGVPNYAQGYPNNLLDTLQAPASGYKNLTTWFKTMSHYNSGTGHGMNLCGKVFHVQISRYINPSDTSNPNLSKRSKFEIIEKIFCARASAALQATYPNEDWSKFDKRKNISDFEYDNYLYYKNNDGTFDTAHGDGLIDYANFILRFNKSVIVPYDSRSGYSYIRLFNSWGLSALIHDNNSYHFSMGHTTLHEMSESGHFSYFLHEFSHNLFTHAHYMGANVTSGEHYYVSNGWGMMSEWFKFFLTTNAWENWYLGWTNVQTASPTNQIYVLKDYVTQNDAIRIPVPNTVNQYLWLENHQLIDTFDHKVSEPAFPMVQGIYAYISHNDDKSNPNHMLIQSISGNKFRYIGRSGNRDYTWDTLNGNYHFYTSADNPISGLNVSQTMRIDKNRDGVITYTSIDGGSNNEIEGIVFLDNTFNPKVSGSGSEAFIPGDEISLSGIVPVLNYPKVTSTLSNVLLEDYLISPLSIKILSYNSVEKSYVIEIKFDDYEIRQNKRWTGNISLHNTSLNNNPDLIIDNGVTLTIDKSGTSNTNVKGVNNEFPDFIRPTRFSIKNNAKVEVLSDAEIKIINGSNMLLESGSTVVIKDNGKITVETTGMLTLEPDANLIVETGGQLIIEGKLIYNNGSNITLNSNSLINIQNGGLIEIGNGATFTWTGNGYIKVNNDPYQPGKVNVRAANGATNARFEKYGQWVNGQGYTQKLIEVNTGTLSFDRSIEQVNISFGQIDLAGETFVDVEPKCYFDNVTFKWSGGGQKHNGLWVYGQQNTPYVNGCKFKTAKRGITVFPLVNGVGTVNGIAKSTRSVITNTTFEDCELQAIYVDARGAEITNCNIVGSNDHTGIKLRGIQYNSLIDQVGVRFHTYGVDLAGNFHNETRIKRSTIYNNGTAGVNGVAAKVSLGCDAIYNNATAHNTGHNIWMHPGSYLIAENELSPDSRYNNLSTLGNSSVYLDRIFGLHIHDGYTNFKSLGYGIVGSKMPFTVFDNPNQYDAVNVQYARNNYWNLSGTSPVNLVDYALSYDDMWTVYFINFDDLGQSLQSPPDITGMCTTGDVGNEPPGMFLGKPALYNGNNQELKEVFVIGRNAKLNGNYLTAYSTLRDIVTYNYDTSFSFDGMDNIRTSEFREWMDVIMYTYSEMVQCINEAYAAGHIDSTYDFSDIIQIQNNLMNKLGTEPNNDTIRSDYAYRFVFHFDRSMFKRLVGKRSDALTELNSMQQQLHTQSNASLLSFYDCLLEKEMYMLSDSVVKESLFNVFHCDTLLPRTYYGQPINTDRTGLRSSIHNDNAALIYPNPVKEKLMIRLPETEGKAAVTISDLAGRTVYTANVSIANKTIEIPITLQTGAYVVKITTGSASYVKKFTVLK